MEEFSLFLSLSLYLFFIIFFYPHHFASSSLSFSLKESNFSKRKTCILMILMNQLNVFHYYRLIFFFFSPFLSSFQRISTFSSLFVISWITDFHLQFELMKILDREKGKSLAEFHGKSVSRDSLTPWAWDISDSGKVLESNKSKRKI